MTQVGFRAGVFLVIPLIANAERQATVSLHFERTPVEQVFASLAAAKQLNLVVAPTVDSVITVQLTNVYWDSAIEMVKKLAKVEVIQQDNILIVSQQQDHGKDQTPLSTSPRIDKKIFTLRYIDVIEVEKKLLATPQRGLSPLGKLLVDPERQSLTVWDTAEALQQIAEWMRTQDTAPPQIEIAAQIISISQENLHELGVSWYTTSLSDKRDPTSPGYVTNNLSFSGSGLTAGVTLAKVNSQLLFLELTALEHENQIEIMASPRLITSPGSTASIKQGTEIPYQTVSGKNENPVIAFKEAVLGMEVTPERVGTDSIKLRLTLSQNVPGKVLQGEGKGPPSIEKQEVSTAVVVADGQTVALGGIFQHQQHSGIASVPWLSQVPIIGLLFRQQKYQQQKRELVIFITPRLLHLRNSR